MKTMEEQELHHIVGGDDFWTDLGQFVGGSIKGFYAGTFRTPGDAGSILSGALISGVAAAIVN